MAKSVAADMKIPQKLKIHNGFTTNFIWVTGGSCSVMCGFLNSRVYFPCLRFLSSRQRKKTHPYLQPTGPVMKPLHLFVHGALANKHIYR